LSVKSKADDDEYLRLLDSVSDLNACRVFPSLGKRLNSTGNLRDISFDGAEWKCAFLFQPIELSKKPVSVKYL
jgi:hypothetical protein